jgi:hypothetical protein
MRNQSLMRNQLCRSAIACDKSYDFLFSNNVTGWLQKVEHVCSLVTF